uniref:7TM GPCR serpentine receptor class x (Srx) domain-containing protein n=1 Tax=Panagrolaimus sp. JU765 TaxID=591449 RepID=A0AC34RI53_9BILA
MAITLIEFVTQMLLFLAEGTMYLYMLQNIRNGPFYDIYFSVCWISDLAVLVKPYTLLLISQNVKKAFMQTYRFRKKETRKHVKVASIAPLTVSTSQLELS